MRGKGLDISPKNLKLADNAALILPSHGALDRAREERRGDKKIGTTGRGIGPAYEDKVGRRAIRVCDLADRQALEDRVDEVLAAPQRVVARPRRARGRPQGAAGGVARGCVEGAALCR